MFQNICGLCALILVVKLMSCALNCIQVILVVDGISCDM